MGNYWDSLGLGNDDHWVERIKKAVGREPRGHL